MIHINKYKKSRKSFSLSKTCFRHDKSKKALKAQKRWKLERKSRGFDNTELWNLDATIAEFTLPRLIAFKEMDRHGLICLDEILLEEGLIKASREYFDTSKLSNAKYKKIEAVAIARWESYLDKMIEAFYYVLEDFEYDEKGKTKPDMDKITFKGSNKKINQQFKDENKCVTELDVDKKSHRMKKQQQIIEEGLSLFAKYFCALWD